MRIDPTLAAAIAPLTMTNAPRSGARFEPREREGVSRRAATRPTLAPATLTALLSIQEDGEGGPGDRRRRTARRGTRLLDALDALRASLLAGRVSPDVLQRLEAGLSDEAPTGDPGLDDAMAAIELRVQVELAKLRAGRRRAPEA